MSRDNECKHCPRFPPRHSTIRAIFLCLCVCLLADCTAQETPPKYYSPQTGRLDAASQEFLRQMHYPYSASKAKRRQIERAARELHVEMSKAQALAILGPPDIKTDYEGFPPKIPPSQSWTYFHTWRYRNKAGYYGKALVIDFEATSPHTICSIEFPRSHEVGR